MASRQVVEHTCDRCTRTWYVDATSKATLETLTLTFHGSTVEYNCLCDGCTKTVSALVAQIAKVMKKSAPVRGAKKKVEEEAKAQSTTQSTTVSAPADAGEPAAQGPTVPKVAQAHVAASSHAPAGAAPRHPTR